MKGGLQIFKVTTLKMEKQDVSATEVSIEYVEIKEMLEKENVFQ